MNDSPVYVLMCAAPGGTPSRLEYPSSSAFDDYNEDEDSFNNNSNGNDDNGNSVLVGGNVNDGSSEDWGFSFYEDNGVLHFGNQPDLVQSCLLQKTPSNVSPFER